MASITIRNLENDTKHRMKLRAALHGRSMEEEARDILRRATAQEDAPADLSATIRNRLSTADRMDLKPPPRPVSLSEEVMAAASRLGIDVSQVCEQHLREVVKRTQDSQWREEHAGFIAAYNATVEAEGLPLDEWRSF
jgi:antitoxin CcdA